MRTTVCTCLLASVWIMPALAQQPQGCNGEGVTITNIVANQSIRGQVTDSAIRAGFEVVVYVHTDQWYIHPYRGQGEGMSFASINPRTGDWTIRTVKRQFISDAVAVAVVPQGQALPGTLDDVSALKPKASCVMQLNGTPFQGML